MVNDKGDTNLQDKKQDEETPFGIWKAAPRSQSNEQETQSGPSPVVTSEDGSQRLAQPNDFSGSLFKSQSQAPSNNSDVKSFSATFGVSPSSIPVELPPVHELFEDDQPAATVDAGSELVDAQAKKQPLLQLDPSMFSAPAAKTEEEEEAEQFPAEPAPVPEIFRKEPQREDPFAWSPEEIPTSDEPRHQRQPFAEDAAWLAPTTDYSAMLEMPVIEQAPINGTAQVKNEPVSSTVNPYTFGKENQWKAPPMTIEEEAAKAAEEEAAQQQPEPQEAPVPSPFDFATYGEPARQDAEAMETQLPLTDPFLPVGNPEQPDIIPELDNTPPLSSETAMLETELAASEAPAESEIDITSEPVAPALEDSLPEDTMPAQPEEQPEEQPTTEALQPDSYYAMPETAAPPVSNPFVADTATDTASPFMDKAVTDTPESQAYNAYGGSYEPVNPFDSAAQNSSSPFAAEATPAYAYEPQKDMNAWVPQPEIAPEAEPAEISTPAFAEMTNSDASQQPFAETQAWQPPTEPASGEEWPHISEEPYAANADTQPYYEQPEPQTDTSGGQRQFGDSTIHHILQEHMHWLQSGGKNGRRANFRNANLQGFDLGSAQLAEASLRGADLSGANLSGADLCGADLSEAVLDGTNLGHANLGAAILTRADLRTAYLAGADMHSADISSAMLLGANLAGLNLASAILQDTHLEGADLTHANLQNANLRGANLRGANLGGALLASANCRDVCFDQAILDHAVFDGANMKNASMQGASLIGVDIAAAEEISAEHRQESLSAEKGQIQQEWERIRTQESQVRQLQAQIQQREMTLQSDRANIERAKREMRSQFEGVEILINKTYEVMARHRIHDKKMKYLGISWFILTTLILVGIMLFVKALEISELDWMSLSIVIAGCALIMGLVIATTIRSIKLSNNLKHLLEVYDKQFPQQDNSGQ